MPFYKIDKNIYNVPESDVEEFEKNNPNATVRYQHGKNVYDVPVSERGQFLDNMKDVVPFDWDPYFDGGKKGGKTDAVQPEGKRNQAAYIEDATAGMGQRTPTDTKHSDGSMPESEIQRLKKIKYDAQQEIDSAGFFDRFFNPETRMAVATRNQAEQALETYEEAKHSDNGWFDRNVLGVFRGIGDKIGDLDTWDFGASGIASAVALKDAAEKSERGEPLTTSERRMLDAYGLASAVQSAYQDKVGMAYNVGTSLPESAGFMVSLAANPAAGLGKKVAERAAKTAVKKYGKTLVSKLAKGAARAGGDMAEMAIATATTGAGRVAEDYYNRLNGEQTFDIDNNGIIRWGGRENQEEADAAIWKAFGSQFIENYSEKMGEYMSPFGKKIGEYMSPLGEMISGLTYKGLKKANLNNLADEIGRISSSQLSTGIQKLKEKTLYDGLVGEYLEEVAGNIMNASTVGDMNFGNPEDPRSVFNPETNIETFLSCALMSGTMLAVETSVNTYNSRKMKRSLDDADKNASGLWGEDRWSDMRNQMDESDPQQLAQWISSINNSYDLSNEQKKAAMGYAGRLLQYQAFNARKMQNQMESTEETNAINNSYDEGTETVEPAERHEAKIRMERAESALGANSGDAERESFASMVMAGKDNPVESIRKMGEQGYTEEQIEDAKEYYVSYFRMKGMTDSLLDDVESQVQQYNNDIDNNTHKDYGYVMRVQLNDGTEGFVIEGFVVQGQTGEIDGTASDDEVAVRMKDGQKRIMNPAKDIKTILSTNNAEDMKEYIDVVKRQQLIDNALGEINWNPSTPEPKVGDVFERNGQNVVVVSVDENGNMTVAPEEEERKSEGDISKIENTENVPVSEFKDFASAQIDAQQQQGSQQQQPSDINQTDDARTPEETPVNTPETPTDKDGNIDFVKFGEENTMKFLSDTYGESSKERVKATTDSYEEELKKAEAAMQKAKSALDKAPIGKDIKQKKTYDTAVEAYNRAKTEFDFWNAINGRLNVPERQQSKDGIPLMEDGTPDFVKFGEDNTVNHMIEKYGEKSTLKAENTMKDAAKELESAKAEVEKAMKEYDNAPVGKEEKAEKKLAEAEAKLQNAKRHSDFWSGVFKQVQSRQKNPSAQAAAEIREMIEPSNGEELAANAVSGGGIRLLMDSFMKETGYSKEEARKFIGIFASKENGGLTIEEAGERLMQEDRENGANLFDQSDPNAGRNALIEMLSKTRTRGDITNFVRNNREEQARREEEAAMEAESQAKEEWSAQNFHMGYDDMQSYYEQFIQSSIESSMSRGEYDEFMANFADETINTEQYEQGISTESNQGDQVLPHAQPDFAGGEEVLQGGSGQDNNNSIDKGVPVQEGAPGSERLNAGSPVPSDNIEDVLAEAERISKEDEIQRTAASFQEETQEKASAFDSKIPGMTDEELLAYMREDGNGDSNGAYHPALYDEYDNRHVKDVSDSYDGYLQSLMDSGTTVEQAEEMLSNLTGDLSRFATSERPYLLGQEEALRDYISKLNQEVPSAPSEEDVYSRIEQASHEVNTNPTEAQIKAGNYKKGHVRVDGYDVTIENPKGSVRRGTDASGKEWRVRMNNTYGYIRGTEGVDGDHIDVFFSEDPSQGDVFVVDQVNKDGSFDEHKVMYGFASEEEARKAYLSNYEEGWQGLGAITHVSKDEFKKWVESSHRKTKPFADYKNVKEITEDVDQRRTNVDKDGLVVDAEGNPLTLYHGTPNDFEFSSLESGHVRDGEEVPARFNGNGISFTPDRTVATEYATSEGGKGKVFEVNVTLKKPYFTVGVANFTPEEAAAFTEGLIAKGYDGIINYSSKWMREAGALPSEVIVFDKSSLIPAEDGQVSEKAATYKTKDGKSVSWQSLFNEAEMRGESPVETDNTKKNTDGNHTDRKNHGETPTGIRLRKLEDGEICHVERIYEETGLFNFTGKEKIESLDDVAYIFKQLEDASVENTFLVLVKDDKPTVIHLAIGDYSSSYAPFRQAFLAYKELDPESVILVHNHPSGTLKASYQDIQIIQDIQKVFGKDVVEPGIIIDTTSGKYGMFDATTNETERMPSKQEDAVPLKVFRFSRQVFSPGWNPDTAFKITSSRDVASFVSSHRLGQRKKMSLIVTNNAGNITANLFLPWTRISEVSNIKDACDMLSAYIHQCGGTRGIIYGNYQIDSDAPKVINKISYRMNQLGTPLLDVIHIDHSARDEGMVGEPSSERIDNESGTRYQKSEENRTVPEREASLRDALVESLRSSGIEVIADSEEGQHILDNVNGGARMQAKKRALETVSSSRDERYQQTVVSSADGAKILSNLDKLVRNYEENEKTLEKTFIGTVANAIGAQRKGSKSEYATFETKNGRIVTIRMADHNATVSNFDRRGELDGISIVISPKKSGGITNDGDAHVVEYYYDAIKLRRADGKPLADIVRSIKQALYSGEFEDTTGLAERQEVNADEIRQQKVYHGSGADFDAFDHSHMGEGEGNQTFGWGTYVTEVEAIGRTYAKANNNSLRKSKLESDIRRLKEALPFRRGDAKREGEEELKRLEEELSKFEDWKSVLYTVEIPDDNGTNYLGWDYAPMNSKQYEMWYDAMRILGEEEYYSKPSEMPNGVSMFNAGHEINSLGRKYSPENVSKALSKAGFAGIYYSSQYNSGGNEEGKRNYVIFNEADAKITGKVRFFRTGDGHAYGFTAGGKIYIDPRIATSETPIHEYAHLWASAMRSVNPTEWSHIVSLMKGTSVWEEVKGKYPELKTDDEIADEVLATYSGRRGAEMLRSAEEEILKNGKDAMPVASALDAINKVKDALKRFWKGVADFLGVHFTTAEEVADKVMADLLNGVNPNSYAETGFAKGSEEAAIVEKAKADGTYMKAPNGEKSNLNSRQWVQVRTKAFKEWFGDWEKAARIEKLRKIKGASITGKEIEISDDYKQNKKNALEYGKKLQGEYTNADTGISVQLQRGRKNGGIKEVLQHNYKDIPHVLSVAAIPQIIEKSIHIESEPNNDIAKNPDVVEYQHFVCGLKIGNEDYTVHSLVAVDKHGNRYYDHNLTKIEKTKLLDQIEGQAVNGQGFDATSGTEPTTLNGYKDKKLFSILQANCSKVVDENGEPMVVYHGSGDTFTIFSPQSEWHGNFFSSERSVAESYSPTSDNVIFEEKKRPFVDVKFKDGRIERQYYDLGGIYNVYLDIKKPLLVDCKGKNWNDIHFKGIKTTTDHISDYALKQGCDGVIFINLIDGAHRGLEASNTFVAFNPNQIKSATDNIGTFDGNNPDIRYQFVGEKGAAEADKMEEATVRLDNLGVARDMEKAGKDERTIKLATGWERGGDGKWRYEIEDFDNSGLEKIVREDNKKKLRLSEHRRTLLGRKWEMEDEIYPDRYFDEFSDEEREQWDRKHSAEIAELNDLIKEIDRLKKQENSSDIITDLGTVIGKAHVLLKYYPELENVVVHITSMPSSVGGIYKSGVITLNRGALYDSSILNHEVQHAIQEIEGFARGGSVRDVRNRIRRRIAELDGVSEHAKEMLARQLEYRALSSKIGYVYERLMKNGEDWAVKAASDNYWEAMNTLDNDENSRLNNVYPKGKNASEIAKEGFNREKAIDELKRLSDYYASQISAEDMNNIKASESLSGKIDGKSDEELYLALGGEVEARNVQARLVMTTEERRRSLASETEDVAREDQIFLEDGLGVSEMGSRVDGRMAEIGRIYDGRELDGNARKLVDVYSGKSNNETITVGRDGKAHKVVMRQGAENKAGTKHSVLRHYGTGVGTVTADDLLLIPEVLGRGQLEEKGRKRVYRMSKDGVIYTVLTEYNNGREDFSDFYSNRKGGNISSLNTQLSARGYDATTNSAAKVVENFENPSIDGEKSKEYNGAEYMDDAAISELNNELSGQWMKREGNMPANTSSAADKMAEKARSISQKLNLDNVEIVTDTSTLEGKKRRAKGFYERSTGKITIVVPNHTGMADIEQTLLHEAVAHYGLRKLMGYKFGYFLDYVYQQASGPMREKINALAEKNGWDFHTATEEYLASLAEDTDFAHRYRIWWSKVKSELLRLLGKIGFKNLSSDGITDNELRYILWRSYRNLSESGRYRSILGEAEDIVMQDKLKVGNYAESTLFRSIEQEINGMQDNTARNMYERVLKERSFRFNESFIDAQRALKEIQDAIAAQNGGRIDEWEDAYTTENQLSSRNTIEVENFTFNHLRPMVDAVSALSKKAGVSYEEIKNYLFMKSGLERNRDFAVRDAIAGMEKEGDDTTGIMEGYLSRKGQLVAQLKSGSITFREYCSLMDNEAEAIAPDTLGKDYSGLSSLFPEEDGFTGMALDAVESFEQSADTSEVWEEIRKSTRFTLDKAKDSGVISTDTHKRVSGMFEWYIPMRGWNDTTADEVYDYFDSKGTGVFNNTVKAAKGRTTLAYDPLATIANMAESAIFQGNRNKMKQRLLNLAFNKPTNLITVMDSWIVNRGTEDNPQWEYAYPSIGENDTADEVAAKISDFERDMEDLRRNKMARKVKGKADIPYIATPKQVSEHVIRVKRNGREFTMVVNGNPRAAQAINGRTKYEATNGVIDKALDKARRLMSPVMTTYNPTFSVRNFTRDCIFSNAAVFIKEDNDYGKRFRSNEVRVMAEIGGLMKRYSTGNLDMNKPIDKAFNEFLYNGGETGFVQLTSTEQYKKKIVKMIKESQGGRVKAKKAFDFYMEHIQFFNRCIEDINRFAIFLTSREMGRSITRSVSDAKEITVNFNRSGSGAKDSGFFGLSAQMCRGLYIFFNAGVQSLSNFNTLRKRNPGRFAATLSVFAAAGFIVPFVNYLTGMLLGGDDDDYYDLPEWVRRNNLVLSLGRTAGGPTFFTVALPIEMRAFYGLGETANNLLSGKIRKWDAAMQVVSQFAELLPVNFMEGGGFVNSVMPTAIKPITEIVANKDFTGKPIYRDNGFNRDFPEWTKAYSGTSRMIVNAAELANEATGGDKYVPGKVDINPAWIDHLIGGYTGGFGQSISEIAGLLYSPIAGEVPSANRIPVVKAFLNIGDDRTRYSKAKKDYAEYKKEYEQTVRRLNGYQHEMKVGDGETAVEYAERLDFLLKSDEMRIYPIMQAYEKAINKAYEMMRESPDADVQKSIEESINILKSRAVYEIQKLE